MQDRRGNQLIFSTVGTQEHRHHTRNVTGLCEERKSTTRLPSPLWVTWKSPGRPCFGRQCTGATSSESCGGVDSMKGDGLGGEAHRHSTAGLSPPVSRSQLQRWPAVRVVELSRTWLLRSGSSSAFSTDNDPAFVSRSWGPGPGHLSVPRSTPRASITKRDAYMTISRS